MHQSHYEVNVSHNGRHLFATHARSCIQYADAQVVYQMIKGRFPEKEGFKVTVTYWQVTGTEIAPK